MAAAEWSPDCSSDAFSECGLRSTAVEGTPYDSAKCKIVATALRYAWYYLDQAHHCYMYMSDASGASHCGCADFHPPADHILLPAFNRSALEDENAIIERNPLEMAGACRWGWPCGMRFLSVQGGTLTASQCRAAAEKMGGFYWCLRDDRCYAYYGHQCGCRAPHSYEVPSSCPLVDEFDMELGNIDLQALPKEETWSASTVAMAAAVGAMSGAGVFSALMSRRQKSQVLLSEEVVA